MRNLRLCSGEAVGDTAAPAGGTNGGWHLQQHISGRVLGVTCIVQWPLQASSKAGGPGLDESQMAVQPQIRYLGATESWQADDWRGPTEFIYRGSWGPIGLTDSQQKQVIQAARYLAGLTRLTGWLQFDLIEDHDGLLWLLEVNPRWTAGMEVLHRSGLVNPALEHARAWGVLPQQDLSSDSVESSCKRIGKAIVYCERDLLLSEDVILRLQSLPRAGYADIPSSRNLGQVVRAGHPLLTVLADTTVNTGHEQARSQLLQKLQAAERALEL